MADLRHLLGLLNPAADGSAPLQPLPGLDQLDVLDAYRSALELEPTAAERGFIQRRIGLLTT